MNVLEVKDPYIYHYDDLVESFGYDVLVAEEEGDYQGDTMYLLRRGAEYGVLVFGWGSCSAAMLSRVASLTRRLLS